MFSRNFKKIQTRLFFVVLLGVLALFGWMLLPYAYSLLWAIILASLFYPLYEKLVEATNSPNGSASLITTGVIFAVIIPIALIIAALVREMAGWYEYLSDPNTVEALDRFVQAQQGSFLGGALSDIQIGEQIRVFTTSLASSALSFIRDTSLSTASFIAKLFVMLYLFFFFLRDGKMILRRIERLLPLGNENERKLFEKFTSTSRATLKGTLLLSTIQGLIGGLFFALVGLPSVVFFTIVMIFLSIIPALGAFMVLGPAIVYLFFTATVWHALILALGAVLVNISDNILRPMLVGKDIEMHPTLILLSTVGGLVVFGISGIVFGPVLAAFLLALFDMYEERYRRDIDKEAPTG